MIDQDVMNVIISFQRLFTLGLKGNKKKTHSRFPMRAPFECIQLGNGRLYSVRSNSIR